MGCLGKQSRQPESKNNKLWAARGKTQGRPEVNKTSHGLSKLILRSISSLHSQSSFLIKLFVSPDNQENCDDEGQHIGNRHRVQNTV